MSTVSIVVCPPNPQPLPPVKRGREAGSGLATGSPSPAFLERGTGGEVNSIEPVRLSTLFTGGRETGSGLATDSPSPAFLERGTGGEVNLPSNNFCCATALPSPPSWLFCGK